MDTSSTPFPISRKTIWSNSDAKNKKILTNPLHFSGDKFRGPLSSKPASARLRSNARTGTILLSKMEQSPAPWHTKTDGVVQLIIITNLSAPERIWKSVDLNRFKTARQKGNPGEESLLLHPQKNHSNCQFIYCIKSIEKAVQIAKAVPGKYHQQNSCSGAGQKPKNEDSWQ